MSSTGAPAGDYPPAGHLLRQLALGLTPLGERAGRADLPASTLACTAAGHWSPWAVAVAADVLAGSIVGRLVAPDWMATAELAIHLGDGGARPAVGELVVDASVLRSGRTTVVVDAVATAGGPEAGSPAEVVAEVVATFVRLPRRDTTLDIGAVPVVVGERRGFASPGAAPPTGGFAELLRADEVDGVWRCEVVDEVRNSFGALHGGAVVAAAGLAVEARAGAPVRDVVVHYVGQARSGPVQAEVRPVRGGAAALWRVELHDAGAARPVAVAHVSTPA